MPTLIENATTGIKPPTFSPDSAGLKTPSFQPPAFANSGGITSPTPNVPIGTPFASGPATQQWLARANRLNARGGVLGARAGVIDLSNPSNPLRSAYNSAGQNVLSLTRASYPLMRNVISAKSGVIGAQRGQTQAERALLAAEYGANSARTAELADIRAGKADVADQAAVALMDRYRANRNSFLGQLGVQAPSQVETPDGYEGKLPFGTEAATMTRAQRAEARAAENEKDRTLSLANLKLGVQGKGLDVKDAQSLAAEAGISLDWAEQAIKEAGGDLDQAKFNLGLANDKAGYNQDLANLNYEQTGLALDQSQEPPKPGQILYQSPDGSISKWVYPDEKDDLDYQYRQQQAYKRYPDQYAQQQWQQRYGQQQQTGGSPLAAIPVSGLLDQYNRISPPGATITPQMIKAELVRRAMATQHYSQQQAEIYAQQLIDAEMEKRRLASNRGGGSTLPTAGAG